MNREPLRILHISDLHFDGTWSATLSASAQGAPEGVARAAAVNLADEFITSVKRACDNRDYKYPKLVIVSGDLVEKGGLNEHEFQQAAEFLERIRTALDLAPQRIFIVPGNHDVDWTHKKPYLKRFEGYMKLVDRDQRARAYGDVFTSPRIFQERLTAHLEPPRNLAPGVKVEVALLASPTFSGTEDPEKDAIKNRLRELLPELEKKKRDDILDEIWSGQVPYDIAAIGAHQRRQLAEMPSDTDPECVRIAVMHHHLLPVNTVEVTPFETIIDAGQVLQVLLDRGFDLVLTGHRHTRHLGQYRRGDDCLDVFSAPSLFRSYAGTGEAFTLIDVHGNDGPYYATLRSFPVRGGPCQYTENLVRQGRVSTKVLGACANIPPREQEAFIVPFLDLAQRFLDRRREIVPNEQVERPDGEDPVAQFVSLGWKHHLDDLERLANLEIVLRSERMYDDWKQFIDAAIRAGAETIRLISVDDLDYWIRTAELPGDSRQDERHYVEPLRHFHEKTRVLVVQERDILDNDRPLIMATRPMLDDGYRVLVVKRVGLSDDIVNRADLSIIGDIAVSRWVHMGEGRRELRESLDTATIEQAEGDWSYLTNPNRVAWDSAGDISLEDWISRQQGRASPKQDEKRRRRRRSSDEDDESAHAADA